MIKVGEYNNKIKKGNSTITKISVPVNIDRPLSPKQVESYAVVKDENKSKVAKILVLAYAIILSTIVIFMYGIYASQISAQIASEERAWSVIGIFAVRIGLLLAASIYMFYKWFDGFNTTWLLFGLFFLTLALGKLFGLLMNLVFFQVDEATILTLSRIRIIFVIITMLPMIYLSIKMILLYLSKKYPSLNDPTREIETRWVLILSITFSAIIGVALAPNLVVTGILVAIITISSLSMVAWLFFFAHRREKLPEINPRIVGIGFLAYLVSSVSRPVFQVLMGLTVNFTLLVETIDIIVLAVILYGIGREAKY